MADIILARPNWVAGSNFAAPAIAGGYGSWSAGLPAANVLTSFLAQPARSTDTAPASTRLRMDLGTLRNVDVFAVPKSNVSTLGRIRLTACSDPDYTTVVHAGDWVDYWSDVYPWGSRPWGSPGLFSPKFSAEDADGYPAAYYMVLPSTVIARYWQVEIDDAENGDGYVELSRLVLAPAWAASVNPVPGQSWIGWEPATRIMRSRTGVKFSDPKPSRRRSRLVFDLLPENEVFTHPFEMARKEDLHGEVFIVTNRNDAVNSLRHAFLANLSALPDFNYGLVNYMGFAVEIEEVL